MSLHTGDIDKYTALRILAYLNSIRSAEDLVQSLEQEVSDDPTSGSSGSGYTIGATVASRLINHRNKQRGRRFTSIDQLEGIEGFGQDKLNDLAYSFADTAEDRFVKKLYSGIIQNNWNVQHSSEQFEDDMHFRSIITNDSLFESWVSRQVSVASQERFSDRYRSLLSGELVRGRYTEVYPGAHLGAYAWAHWFYRVDLDNWFTFDKVRIAIEEFLSTYEAISGSIELRIIKGYPNWAGLTSGITPSDLVVTLNHVEKKASIWSAELFD